MNKGLSVSIGDTFGKLTVISDVFKNQRNKKSVKCICKCGKESTHDIYSLLDGKVISCGCYSKSHNITHNMTNSGLYAIWRSMKCRCLDPNNYAYKNYGGRGIKLCEEWLNITEFVNWMKNNGWKKGLQIDRIDNDGNYEPSNCRLVTAKENCGVGRRRLHFNSKTGYVGVYHSKGSKSRFCSEIMVDGVRYKIGIFDSIPEAVIARINKEIELFGEQKTNFHFTIDK